MICVDGGKGLLAALPSVFDGIPVQRCWAHKIRNILNKVRRADQPKVKRALHKVMNAANAPAARSAARRFAEAFDQQYPAAVACLRNDLDELLTCFRYRSETARRAVRTTDEIDKSFLLLDLLFWRSTGDRVAKSRARGCQPDRAAVTVAPHWRHPCAASLDHAAATG
jgi:transposase-like protein